VHNTEKQTNAVTQSIYRSMLVTKLSNFYISYFHNVKKRKEIVIKSAENENFMCLFFAGIMQI